MIAAIWQALLLIVVGFLCAVALSVVLAAKLADWIAAQIKGD